MSSIYAKPIVFSVVALVVILIGSVVTAFYPLIRADMHPKLGSLESYTPIELAGRDIYQKEGCSLCHTQTVRPLKSDVLRYGGAYSFAGESAYERPFLWGSRRTGPDLARVGNKYSDDWHLKHFVDPRHFYEKSNMPSYYWLENVKVNAKATESHMKTLGFKYKASDIDALADTTELEALTAYMQQLGKYVDERPYLVTVSEDDYMNYNNTVKSKPETLSIGSGLYKRECAGCHGANGEGYIASDILKGYSDVMDEMYSFMTIANGIEGMMPGFINTMTYDQVASLVEHIATIE
jgi:cytochrome c oxidase cbb3-type subunit 2